MRYSTIIFDIDGTLLDTSQGIFSSVRYAEKMMGLQPTAETKLCSFVGPPPKEQYIKVYGISEETAIKATIYHRKYGIEKGIYESRPYDGIHQLIARLKEENRHVCAATLKRQDCAESVLKIHSLYDYFDCIIGTDDSESLTKADAVCMCLKSCRSKPAESVLIGDSKYDALGAADAKVDFIGVTYGFGFKNETDVHKFPNIASASLADEIYKFL